MDAEDLRKVLEKTSDKLKIFTNIETLQKYKIKVNKLFELIDDFLNDEEKLKLFNYSHFLQFDTYIKCGIIGLISDSNVLLQLLNNDNVVNDFQNYQIIDIIKKLNDDGKKQILQNEEFIKKHDLKKDGLVNVISSLGDEAKTQILCERELLSDKLHLTNWQIAELARELKEESSKKKILETYELETYLMIEIINTLNVSSRIKYLLEDTRFSIYDKKRILSSLDIDALSGFLRDHKKFFTENGIYVYEIVKMLDINEQLNFVAELEEMNLTLNEKRMVLATLNPETKQNIDTKNLKKEYKTAIDLQTTRYGQVIVDLERDLEDYRGLDNCLRVNPEEFTESQRTKFIKLCDICPEMEVGSTLDKEIEFTSSASEYKEAEEWISNLLNSLKPEYSKAQKIAIIDNAIGKKISYSPDYDTEVFNTSSCRALWKIISSGYGVCNGIARVEEYILSRIEIESEVIGSKNHAFLKIKDIEVSLSNGEIVRGTTILDPTWNLAMHRFGGRPDNFFISYEEARKHDIGIDGKDYECHKNDEKLQDATLNLDDKSLRQLFASVELADSEGQFPLKDLVQKSQLLDIVYANEPSKNIDKQFQLLSITYPEFAKCQNSTMSIIKSVLLNNDHLSFDKCVVNRVYDRKDKDKTPFMFVYIASNEIGKKFYYANKDEGKFEELPQEEFIERFECYEEDLEKSNGIRPWESDEQEKEDIDLSKSSGEIAEQKEEGR